MVQTYSNRFFVPPYVGPSGWIGIWVDGNKVDWKEIRELIEDSSRLVAPKRLLAALDN